MENVEISILQWNVNVADHVDLPPSSCIAARALQMLLVLDQW